MAPDPARENGPAVTQPWPVARRSARPDQPPVTVAKPARMARVWPNKKCSRDFSPHWQPDVCGLSGFPLLRVNRLALGRDRLVVFPARRF